MNEEEIRGKLLLPFLNDLGFDSSEISLEKSFKIRLGKTQHIIKGRSDILCKRNGKNLFIIELKSDSISISQQDIDQGISYARALIDNIAPFTIITNGKTTKIFDSISRTELTGEKISKESDFWKNDYTLSTDEELRIRFEALKKFVSFSAENLKVFCKSQVQERMGPIIGSIDDPSAKFVKELYIQRKNLQEAFNNFVNSEASFFGIVGSAGVGKTNAMCSLALQSLEDKFVFFYNAAIINKSPLEHIAQDLNGAFSSKNESGFVLKKLDELGRFLNKNVLIFIDAIDESVDTNISLELSEIALACRNSEKVKLCISCKSNIWKEVLIKNDTPTHLFEELEKSHGLVRSLGDCPAYLLEDFSVEELNGIIPLYKTAFGFEGEMSKTLLKELKNGFFLRIFSDVYSHKQIPEKINDKDLIKKYIKQSLDKTKIGFQPGLRILSKIAKILISHRYNSWDEFKDEGLEVDNLLEKLNFSVDQTLPNDLFTRNILIKSNKDDSYNIAFYYSKIRDYIICFHTYKLDQLNENEFYNILGEFYQNYIGRSAIAFYIENASAAHKSILIKFKRDKALSYVVNYDSFLNENFRRLKIYFDPQTEGSIGIMLPLDLLKEDGYALFPLDSNSSNRIQYENLGSPFSRNLDDSLFFQKGVKSVHSSNISLLVPDQSKSIRNHIFKQLKELIKKGKFNAYNSDILLREQLSTIMYYYSQKLGYDFKLKDVRLPRFDLIYPINLKELRDRIYKFRAAHYYKRSKGASDNINQLVEEAIAKDIDIPGLNTSRDFPPFEELFRIVNTLLNKGFTEIQNHHLPCPDKSIYEAEIFYEQNMGKRLNEIRVAQYSVKQALLYIESFFKCLEVAYQEFVEYCFPTFKDKFQFYTTLPNEYFFYLNDSNVLGGGWFGCRPSKCGKIKLNIKICNNLTLEKAFKEDNISIIRGFSFDSILNNDYHNQLKTIDRINTPDVDDYCVIRNWVYRLLKEDMEELFKENEQE